MNRNNDSPGSLAATVPPRAPRTQSDSRGDHNPAGHPVETTHLQLPAADVVDHVATLLDAGARREALAVLRLLQLAVTTATTPHASHLFTALRAWEGAIVGMNAAEELLNDDVEVEQLMRWWTTEQHTRHDARQTAR